MKSLCVFCGSHSGKDPQYVSAAQALAQVLITEKIALVYGGATVGMMGSLADQVLAGGGKVIGVIPGALFQKEIPHQKLTKLITTDSMHERKQIMYDRSEAFLAMPGGLGTLDELCEILTWAQMGLHHKPVGLFNVKGYFNSFLQFLDHSCQEGFLNPEHRNMILSGKDPEDLIRRFQAYQAPKAVQWIAKEER